MARRPQPGLPIFIVSAVCCLGLVVGASVYSSKMQFGAVHNTYESARAKVQQQVAADKDARAALARVEASGFAASATSLVAALEPCLGPSAVAATTSGLKQLAGFSGLKPGRRAVLPPAVPSDDDASEIGHVQQMVQALQIDQERTAQTMSAVQSNLIGQDEVDQALDAVAAGIVAAPKALVAKNRYAARGAKSDYSQAVASLEAVVTKIAPSLKTDNTVKISEAQSESLQASLSDFAAKCRADAASNASKTPHMVMISYPQWGMKSWPVENFPFSMTLTVDTPGDPISGCTSTKLIAEGIARGGLGAKVTVTVSNVDVPVYKILTHYTSATSAQWAVVACAAS